jgi:hypothetical protein
MLWCFVKRFSLRWATGRLALGKAQADMNLGLAKKPWLMLLIAGMPDRRKALSFAGARNPGK